MENTTIDGRYTLLTPLGAGGEARVFRARDAETQSEVAVKLSLSIGSRTVSTPSPATFHPGWVHLVAAGIDEQHGAYQVFELLEGRTLREIVALGPLNASDWRRFVEESLSAIDALHGAVGVHGDLNADNFLLTSARWKILELPFARFEAPAGRSLLFGSIHTLSPEQIDGAPPSVQSDLYALGCLYYYAASGAYPHSGASVQEIVISRLRFAPPPLRETAPGLPIVWCDWVMKLIAPEPADRFPTIAAARQLLD